jgi:hypothetical protein
MPIAVCCMLVGTPELFYPTLPTCTCPNHSTWTLLIYFILRFYLYTRAESANMAKDVSPTISSRRFVHNQPASPIANPPCPQLSKPGIAASSAPSCRKATMLLSPACSAKFSQHSPWIPSSSSSGPVASTQAGSSRSNSPSRTKSRCPRYFARTTRWSVVIVSCRPYKARVTDKTRQARNRR